MFMGKSKTLVIAAVVSIITCCLVQHADASSTSVKGVQKTTVSKTRKLVPDNIKSGEMSVLMPKVTGDSYTSQAVQVLETAFVVPKVYMNSSLRTAVSGVSIPARTKLYVFSKKSTAWRVMYAVNKSRYRAVWVSVNTLRGAKGISAYKNSSANLPSSIDNDILRRNNKNDSLYKFYNERKENALQRKQIEAEEANRKFREVCSMGGTVENKLKKSLLNSLKIQEEPITDTVTLPSGLTLDPKVDLPKDVLILLMQPIAEKFEKTKGADKYDSSKFAQQIYSEMQEVVRNIDPVHEPGVEIDYGFSPAYLSQGTIYADVKFEDSNGKIITTTAKFTAQSLESLNTNMDALKELGKDVWADFTSELLTAGLGKGNTNKLLQSLTDDLFEGVMGNKKIERIALERGINVAKNIGQKKVSEFIKRLPEGETILNNLQEYAKIQKNIMDMQTMIEQENYGVDVTYDKIKAGIEALQIMHGL